MIITFILPGIIKIPSGGVKIIFRYAQELSNFGYKVTILSPQREGNQLSHLIKALLIKMHDYYHRVENKPYYQIPTGVEYSIIPLPTIKYIPNGREL